MDVAHTDFAEAPRLFQNLAFELAESETGNFARAAKTAEKKLRTLHRSELSCSPDRLSIYPQITQIICVICGWLSAAFCRSGISRYHCQFSTTLDSCLYA